MFLIGASAQFIPYLLIVLATVVIYINDSVVSAFQNQPADKNINVEASQVSEHSILHVEDEDQNTSQNSDYTALKLSNHYLFHVITKRDFPFSISSYNTAIIGSLQLRAPPIINE
jgi:hypothetical protein